MAKRTVKNKKGTKSEEKVKYLQGRAEVFVPDLIKTAGKWELEFKKKLEILGYEFIFQHPIICNCKSLFIMDFYFPKLGICCELNGHWHYSKEQRKKDNYRKKLLKKEGIKVIEIPNKTAEILKLSDIKQIIESAKNP